MDTGRLTANVALDAEDARIELSVVVPVFNEDANLMRLHAAVTQALEGTAFELVLVDDGSKDRSVEIMRALAAAHPAVAVVELVRNSGQHAAVLAGFTVARGDYVVTLDADLQNPPEDIPLLLAELRRGHDLVGTYRERRHDGWLRLRISEAVNVVTRASLGAGMRDYGCMLRGYRRDVVEEVLALAEQAAFVPALAMTIAGNPVEIPVQHREREEGRSRYSPLKLMRLGLDLITGYSLLPIQLVSLLGVVVAVLGSVFAVFLFVRRLVVGPESEGVFTLFAILFAVQGVLLLAVGLVGEYVGRIYAEVRRRPPFRIRRVTRGGVEVAAPGIARA